MAEYYDPETYPQELNYLQSGTIIDHYIIERELARGGFSSVYLARQLDDQIQVAIKEYLPRKLAHRTLNNVVIPNNNESINLFKRGRALFFEEAKVLADLKHNNIVNVISFFQANETVYMVMDYDYGMTLNKLIKNKVIKIDEEFLLCVFRQLLNGIAVIHEKNYLHLDVKPSNILIRAQHDPLLLDFGAIQKFPIGNASRTKVLTQGFSPIEQYSSKSMLGPWTDIYAVGASMRACLDYKIPMPAPEREKHDKLTPAVKAYRKDYPEYLLKAIDWAMSIQPEMRPQSITEIQEALIA